ncbi:MAG TPA: hypothetical protein VE172_11490 [Stackebrandtia sp.]|jgi:hypothetical protein|uniref:hypothetical protein n=1 Tax=Stackebrandtia sp. TaxID=2023065 RepID=UPI002D42C88F|nr:hypothetical protein [Stackebrandtia sp.]HZE39422.1 hypothetical protein [Stackebrandtia sp.]
MSTIASVTTRKRLQPFYLAVPFTAIITGWFNLSDSLPVPVAVLAGAGWGVVLGLLAMWANNKPLLAAWIEDALVYLCVIGLAFAGCGGLMAIVMLDGALGSSSLSGEALKELFMPTIPYYIIVNGLLEMVIVPALLFFGWRKGRRRVLILVTAALYFGMRVWTYLTFVPSRLKWADSNHATTALTAAERKQASTDLMVDDPRWILLLGMLAVLLVAAYLSRVREVKKAMS